MSSKNVEKKEEAVVENKSKVTIIEGSANVSQVKEEANKSPRSINSSEKKAQEEAYDQTTKGKKQAEMFKKYIDQTGIAMAFQIIFAQILDKKLDESKLFSYTAMRLRQIGEDLQKIKLTRK